MLRKFKVIDFNLLNTKGVSFDYLAINKLIKHPNEHWEHFAVKSQIFYILRNMNHNVLTEFAIKDYGIGDVLDLSTKLTCQYEIETRLQSGQHKNKINTYIRRGLEIIIVYTPKLPKDEYERYKYIKDVVVIPD